MWPRRQTYLCTNFIRVNILKLWLAYKRFLQNFLRGALAGQNFSQTLSAEGLCTIFFFSGPLFVVAFVVDFIYGLTPFTCAFLVCFISMLVGLFALRMGKIALSAEITLFSNMGALMAAYLLGGLQDSGVEYYYAMVSIAGFAAIAMTGFYVHEIPQMLSLLCLILASDLLGLYMQTDRPLSLYISRFSVIFLHILAFSIAIFLKNYIDHLNRQVLARRLMNQSLEEILGKLQTENIRSLRSLGHDLRSPITAIIGVQSLLANTPLTDEQKEYLAILTRSNKILLEMADAILETEQYSNENYSLRPLVESALDPFRAIIKEKKLNIDIAVGNLLPSPPLTRANTLRILSNLIDNAVSYSKSGKITIYAALDKSTSSVPELVLRVSDQGQGMSEERIQAIKNGPVSPDTTKAGSRGLGLASVERIAKLANGRMEISSMPNRGTTVHLYFPLPPLH